MTDYIWSDLHFGHTKAWKEFTLPDGSPMRPFTSDEEMNDALVNNCNKLVKEDDRLFILGDVVINKKHIHNMERINCRRRILVGGNHDVHYDLLAPHFTKILGAVEHRGAILTHIPVHTAQLKRYKFNIHGHLHQHRVQHTVQEWGYPRFGDEDGEWIYREEDDPKYFNVSVEQLNFTPILLDHVFDHLENGTRP